MITKTLRLSVSLAETIRDLGGTEHIKEATAMRKLLLRHIAKSIVHFHSKGRH